MLQKGAPPESMQSLMFGALGSAAKKAGIIGKEWNVIQREAWEVVVALQQEGRSPMWLPHRSIGNRGRSPSKLVGHRITKPQQFRLRNVNNPEPYIRNIAVALEQNAIDHLRLLGTEAVYFGAPLMRKGVQVGEMPGLFNMFGRSIDDLRIENSDAIHRMMEKNRHMTPEEAAQRVISKDWTIVDPSKWGIGERWGPEHVIKYKRKRLNRGTA